MNRPPPLQWLDKPIDWDNVFERLDTGARFLIGEYLIILSMEDEFRAAGMQLVHSIDNRGLKLEPLPVLLPVKTNFHENRWLTMCLGILGIHVKPQNVWQRDDIELLLTDARGNYRELIKQNHPDYGGDGTQITCLTETWERIKQLFKKHGYMIGNDGFTERCMPSW